MSQVWRLPTVYKPTFFVGLGGAGLQIVDRIAGILRESPEWDDVRSVFQFFAIDTDRKDIGDCRHIPSEHRFLISGFDKGAYADQKRGRVGQRAPDPDPRVTQWLHDWYNFRSSGGHGAGQVRLESRLGIHQALESAALTNKMREAIERTRALQVPNVDTATGELQVFCYFSVAGGTGSGCNLTVSYMIRDLARRCGLRARVTACALLPTLFLEDIRSPQNQGDVLCNGYAALKEIEHLMKLRVTVDDRSGGERRAFVYDPFGEQTDVREPPYDFVYVVDTPADLDLGPRFRDAVADGVYLQLLSPIFAVRDADFDNYEKNQKRLAAQLYTTFYGSFGCAVLVLPDKDILEYCALRQTADAIRGYFPVALETSDGKRFPSEQEEAEWSHLPEGLRHRLHDFAFVRCLLREHELRSTPAAGAGPAGPGGFLPSARRLFRLAGLSVKRLPGAASLLDPDRRKDYLQAGIRALEKAERARGVWRGTAERPRVAGPLLIQAATETTTALLWDTDEPAGRGAGAEETAGFRGWRAVTDAVLSGPDGVWSLLEQALSAPPEPRPPSQAARKADSGVVERAMISDGEALRDWIDGLPTRLQELRGQLDQRFGTTRSILSLVREGAGRDDDGLDLMAMRLYFSVLKEELLFLRDLAGEVARTRGAEARTVEAVRRAVDGLAGGDVDGTLGEEAARRLRGEAKVTFWELMPGTGDEEEEFRAAWEAVYASLRDEWVATVAGCCFLDGVRSVCDAILAPVDAFLGTMRSFTALAAASREQLARDTRAYLENAGQASNRFVVDVEALQDLNGDRLWDRYYDRHIRSRRPLPQDRVVRILTEAFLDDRFAGNPQDIAETVRSNLVDLSREHLHDMVVGRYQSGDRARRGLLLDDALRLEAEFVYVAELEASGRFQDLAEDYRRYRDDPDSDLPSVKGFRADLAAFTAAYLERKIDHCIRISGVLGNVDRTSQEYTLYACRQGVLAYDHGLYGAPGDPDRDLDHFPTLAGRNQAGLSVCDWTGPAAAKRAVFYQAVLGVPLYLYRNVRVAMREAYNARVKERDPCRPERGRLYPLHIDKNWEPNEPGVDPSGLPLSLDPDEAADASRRARDRFCRLALQILTLCDRKEIRFEEERGFLVPEGKLGNKGGWGDVVLGRTLAEAVRTVQRLSGAARQMDEALGGELIARERVEEIRRTYQRRAAADAYGRPVQVSPEVRQMAEVLDDLVNWFHEQGERATARVGAPPLGDPPAGGGGPEDERP